MSNASLHGLLLLLHYEVVVLEEPGADHVAQLLALLAQLLALVKLGLGLR